MNKDQDAYREGYPEELSSAEDELLRVSRQGRKQPQAYSVTDCTGVGLSGGGIRSATFCLGIFQGLATLKLLHKVDYI